MLRTTRTATRAVRLALDWSPNTNHTGFYVAKAQGMYSARDIDVQFILPGTDAARGMTPGRLCAAGHADFALTPSESAVSFATSGTDTPKLLAVAAVLQGSTSAICSLSGSGIDRPAHLAGKRYASYGGRFEDAIVRQMVANDGVENPAIDFHPLPQHGYSSDVMESSSVVATMLEKGLSDSTWIFEHWEGVLAARSGKSLNYFRLEDYGIPYGYSPIILANPALLQDNAAAAVARDFLAASEDGFTVAAANCRAAATDLQQEGCHSTLSDLEFLVHSQEIISSAYLDENGRWGTMEPEQWRAFLDFMLVNDIVVDDRSTGIDVESIAATSLFTDEFLPSVSGF